MHADSAHLRFEAKHNYFKKVAARLGNFINVANTVAVRHQCLACYYYAMDKFTLGSECPEIGPGKAIPSSDLPLTPDEISDITLYQLL